MKKQIKLLMTLVGMLILCSTSFAKPKIIIKLATIAPPKTPWVTHLEKWRDNLLKSTNGEIEIKLYTAGQMGTELDTIKMVRRGRITVVAASGGVLAELVPELSLMSTPFLFDKVETIDCIYDREVDKEFRELIREKNLEVLQWAETGWVYAYAKDNLSNPEMVKEYKIRVSTNPMSRLLWSAMGANGIELPYIETPSALQTGMVKGGGKRCN